MDSQGSPASQALPGIPVTSKLPTQDLRHLRIAEPRSEELRIERARLLGHVQDGEALRMACGVVRIITSGSQASTCSIEKLRLSVLRPSLVTLMPPAAGIHHSATRRGWVKVSGYRHKMRGRCESDSPAKPVLMVASVPSNRHDRPGYGNEPAGNRGWTTTCRRWASSPPPGRVTAARPTRPGSPAWRSPARSCPAGSSCPGRRLRR